MFNEIGLAYKIRTVLPSIRDAVRRGDLPDDLRGLHRDLGLRGRPPVGLAGRADRAARPRQPGRRLHPGVRDRQHRHRLLPAARPQRRDLQPADPPDHRPLRATPSGSTTTSGPTWPARRWSGRTSSTTTVPGGCSIGRLMREVANSCDPNLTSGPYWDVPDRHPAAEAIAWVGDRNLFPGYANGTYRAEIGGFVLHATRGELLNMAWKLAGRPTGFGPHPWSDGRRSLEPGPALGRRRPRRHRLPRRHLPTRPPGHPRPGPRPPLAHGRAPRRVPRRPLDRRRRPHLPLGRGQLAPRGPDRLDLRARRAPLPGPAGHPALPLRPAPRPGPGARSPADDDGPADHTAAHDDDVGTPDRDDDTPP